MPPVGSRPGGTSRAKRAGCLGNPRRPGHSSHATGRILKAPVPRPCSSPDPSPAPLLPPRTPPAPLADTGPHPAPRSAPVPAAPGCRRCPEPRGERERGKIVPVCAVPGGRGDSLPPGLREHAGVSVDHPQHRDHTRRVPPAGGGGLPVPPPVCPGKVEGGEPGGVTGLPCPPPRCGTALLAHCPSPLQVGKGTAGQPWGSRPSLPLLG